MQNKTTPAAPTDSQQREQPRPRFIETSEPRRQPLSSTRTEEEAKLAAEIEKLRG